MDTQTSFNLAVAIGGFLGGWVLNNLKDSIQNLQASDKSLAFKDVDSARQMQIATHSKMPAVLTVLVTIGFFGILSMLFFHPDLKGNEIVMVMVGQLSAVWAGCVAFYTGTTYGSANKNAMIAAK